MGFGSALKQTREAQGRTVQEVALATKIRSDYLRALEDDQLDLLPERPLTRSYLQRYARELGLDAAPLLGDFDRRVPAAALPPRVSAPVRRRRPALLAALAGVVLVGGGFGAYRLLRPAPAVTAAVTPSDPATPQTQTVRLTVSSVPSGARVYLDNRDLGTTPVRAFPVQARARAQLRVELSGRAPLKEAVTLTRGRNLRATLAPGGTGRSALTDLNAPRPRPPISPKTGQTAQTPGPSAPSTPAPARPDTAITVTFSGSAWTRVTDSAGRVLFEGIPAAGTVKGFGSGVTIRTGNAAAVQVSVAGQRPSPMGQTGQVVTRTF